jgi:RNA polymerase sigma-B factor
MSPAEAEDAMSIDERPDTRERARPVRPVPRDDLMRSISRSQSLVARARDVVHAANELRDEALRARARRHAIVRAIDRRRRQPREALVADHLPLARHLAGRFTGRGQPFDDLYQVACLGLVKAAERYDPTRGILFRTYAQAVITGELKRHFRDHGWGLHVARPVQELFLAIRVAREDLTHTLGRPPTIRDIAAAVGSDDESVIDALHAGETFYLESVDAPVAPGDESARREMPVNEPGFTRVDERSWLIPAISTLGERDRTILQLRFFDGLSQSQIASRLGISQMHVSRLLSRSLNALRKAAGDEAPVAG